MRFNLQPKHSVVLHVACSDYLRLFFARPLDSDVLKELMELRDLEGFGIAQIAATPGKPYVISIPPTYDIKEVGLEIERLLRFHGISSICIKIDKVGSIEELTTLEAE